MSREVVSRRISDNRPLAVSEAAMPDMWARARQTLANCDWYDADGGFRMDAPPDEDLIIATMVHFARAETAGA